jgi:sulfite exporter TauE/SafE
MLWTAFILGLFGGLHCAGMCGPIALAIPLREGRIQNVIHKSLYNTGRIVTYAILGVLAGLIGQSFNMAGWQQGLSVGLGVFLILVIIFSGFSNLDVPLVRPILALTNSVKKSFSYFLRKRSFGSAFAMGMINGILPCGLVYVAMAASIAGGSIESGAAYMLVFGVGTVPVMLAISLAGNAIGMSTRRKIYKLVPIFIVTLGMLLILRGLNLGIPYISPELSSSDGSTGVEMCH